MLKKKNSQTKCLETYQRNVEAAFSGKLESYPFVFLVFPVKNRSCVVKI